MRDVTADYLPPNKAIEFYNFARNQTDDLLKTWHGAMEIGGKKISIEPRNGNLVAIFEEKEMPIGGDNGDFIPLCEEFPVCQFDIFFPFLSWRDFAYDGPANMMGRRAQRYIVTVPDAYGNSIDLVKIWIDDSYGYPLSCEVVYEKGRTLRRFRVRSLKKDSAGEWTVSSVEFSMPRERRYIHVKILN